MVFMQSSIPLGIGVFALLMAGLGCNRGNADPAGNGQGVVIDQVRRSSVHDQMVKLMTSAPSRRIKGGGVACIQGGGRVKLMTSGTHEILLPMPQLTDSQIPLCYAVITTPLKSGSQFRLCERQGSNTVVTVQLNGTQGQEVKIDWSALILLTDRPGADSRSPAEPYVRATSCVQAADKQVKAQAERLWPANGKIEGYAVAIQDFIRGMKQEKAPRSLDAVSILESRANWICTANANLAAALMRAKGIACRSLAVVPPTGQRLEMHRIVEYFDADHWSRFDPSSLQPDIPLKPWQNIVMAKTTIPDEELAMKPRVGSSFGCPYGQELELLDSGVTPWGNDFFRTQAKPVAEFEVSDEIAGRARREWESFLRSGALSQVQLRVAEASATGLREALETK